MKGKIKLPEGYELEKLENGVYEVVKKPFKLDVYKVVKKPFELELGKDYINRDSLIINRTGDSGNLGFTNLGGVFRYDLICENPKNWREATKEEVVSFFERHLIKKYGEDWESVKIKTCMYFGERDSINTSVYDCYIKKDVDYIDGWRAWNKNGCLYNNGKWAEALEEPKYAEKLEDIDRPWFISGDGHAYKCYYPGEEANHFTTKQRAEQILALTQLLAFRDDIWSKGGYGNCGIRSSFFGLEPHEGNHGMFSFKDKETCEYFIEKHRGLLEIYSGIFEK